MTNNRFNELMHGVQNQDMDALKEIYNEYASYVYHIAFSIIGQKEDSEDVASDVFVKLWDKSVQFKPGEAHKAYLATITRNLAIDFLRKQNRIVSLETNDEINVEIPSEDDLEEAVLNSIAIEDLLSKLKPDLREILHLKFFGGMTLSEIASVLNVPLGTVSWKYATAQKVLRGYGYA